MGRLAATPAATSLIHRVSRLCRHLRIRTIQPRARNGR